ncbi:MAG TPA: hypothetical protein VL948_11380 [Verrucomicrobiae bacterium]|jgi:phenylacetate-CoA ligase|nr:hypothetical protein [Verrucomicrobiae bacterium]
MMREAIYRRLVPGVVHPLGERLGIGACRTVRALAERQWWRPEVLRAHAETKLRALVEHAARHVPYYRDLFSAAGLDPGDVRTLEDLARIPLTTKQELRPAFPQRTTAENLPVARQRRMMTSGSTGVPLEFYWDRAALPIMGGTEWFWLGWAGTASWHTRLLITSPAYFYDQLTPPRPFHRLATGVVLGERTARLPANEATPARFRALVAEVGRRGPYYIRGYPGSLASLAAGLAADGAPLAAAPRVIGAFAETLTPANARHLEDVFGCPVVNYYSAWEVPQIAQTCPDNPGMLHVNERVIARVVGPDGRDVGTGEWGRLVVTDLANFVMPFINYTVGDAAISGGLCPCGRGLPTIARLEGRDTEIIETPDGRVIAAGALGQLLTFVVGIMPYVWEYQAVHAAPTSVRLLVVPTARFSEAFRATVERAVQDFLGPAMRVTVEPVSAIPLEPSGKRLIIRRLPAG